MLDVNMKYIREERNSDGTIKSYEFVYPENFNFAYDIIDEIAKDEPDRKAMVWCNPEGEEHIFTYEDLRKYSDKTANMLLEKGVKKGDMVMVILKRHYQFWFTILALHKIGAVIIPATFMLKPHDVVYRCNEAGVKYIICTGTGETAANIDEALPECKTVVGRIMVKGEREGWDDFAADMERASDKFERMETKAHEPMILYFSSGTTGNPKMALHPHTYADMLVERIERHDTRIWMLNTGLVGGPSGVGKRISLAHTRAIVRAVVEGKLRDVETWTHPVFGVQVPHEVPGVPAEVLHPREAWSDPEGYDSQAIRLKKMFDDAIERIAEGGSAGG